MSAPRAHSPREEYLVYAAPRVVGADAYQWVVIGTADEVSELLRVIRREYEAVVARRWLPDERRYESVQT